MASFSKKIGYMISDVPETISIPEPKDADKSSRWRIVRGHQSKPAQEGVRLLITAARSEYFGCRPADRADFYDTYLTVERANDVVPDDSAKQLSARPKLNKELRFRHAEEFSGSPSTENPKLDAMSKYFVGPTGESATIYDLIEGRVDCLAINAPLYRRTDVIQPKSNVRRLLGGGKLDTDGEDMATDWDVLIITDGKDKCFGMSKPEVAPDLAKHRERTAQAESMVKSYLRDKKLEIANAMLAEDASFVGTMDGPEV